MVTFRSGQSHTVEPLYKDTPALRTPLQFYISVPDATFVYLTTPASLKDTLVCPNGVQIREVPLYINSLVDCVYLYHMYYTPLD